MLLNSQQYLAQAQQLFHQGFFADAEAHALKIPASDNLHAQALKIVASSARKLGRLAEGLKIFEYLAVITPDNADVFYTLGVIYYENYNDRNKAMGAYHACLRLDPDHLGAMWNCADLLRLEEHFTVAEKMFKKLATRVDDSYKGDLYHRWAIVVNLLPHESSDDPLELFEKALEFGSTEPDVTRWEYSHALLGRGMYKRGWEAYDYRFKAGKRTMVACYPYKFPWWQGENLSGKTLLIHGEQGLGDEIMFGQVIPELLDEGASIVLACQPPLVQLFAQSHPGIPVYAHRVGLFGADVSQHQIDLQTAICSLGRWKRGSDKAFKNPPKSLSANADKQAWFKDRIFIKAPDSKDKLKVGLMWGANPSKGIDWGVRRSMQKSISLRCLSPLSEFCDCIQFVSLQNNVAGGEVVLAPELDIIDFSTDLLDMSDTAALVENMDLVITVDTSVAHLSGALAKNTWLMLMKRADWRWLDKGKRSKWYQNMRLFRQPIQGDWENVISQIMVALTKWINEQKEMKKK